MSRGKSILALAASLALAGCGGQSDVQANETNANQIAEDPFGATGAPGADMTDNGVNDGSSGLADGNDTSNAAGAATNIAQ